MRTKYSLASLGELIGDPARASMLMALMDGRTLPAGELAMTAEVSAQSASGHLSKLIDGGLLSVENSGRHRYYRLADAEVGHALEALGAIAGAPGTTLVSRDMTQLRAARSCYDHLAGCTAVELTRVLEGQQVIVPSGERDYELGSRGRTWFAELGVDTDGVRRSRRVFARRCLDWTERRYHVAGALGAALFSQLLALRWLARMPKTRALRITQAGREAFHKRFGISSGRTL